MVMEFDIFQQTLEFVLTGMEVPEEKWYLYILQQLGREGMERWHSSIKKEVGLDDPRAIIKAYKKGFELEETYWTYRTIYLSSSKQAKGESAAALATRVEDLVNLCKWPDAERDQRRIDLFYYLSDYFDVKRYVQNETAKEGGGNLTWESLVNEAKRQERVGKEYARFRRENGDSSTPSYGDPALAADAVSKSSKRGGQQRPRTPSGGRGSQQQCDRCGRRNGCNGQKGTCPAWGKECDICHGRNHYKAVCRKAAQGQASGGTRPKQQGKGKAKSPGKQKKHAHSVVFKTVPSGEKGKLLLDTDADQNSVTSGRGVPLSKAAKRENSVLSGRNQSKTALQTHNVFSCDSIHDTGDGTLDQCQTDTDPSGRLCIMTDIVVRARATSRTHNIRVKVDPGADANLMPVHHFRTIFPYLCDSTGRPKENVLDKAESSFESYSGDSVTVIGQTKIHAKNIQTGKFIPTRVYIIAREQGPILLSNAASQWLGLISVLCENKARPVGRFVASVTREERDGGEAEAHPIAKTGDGPEGTMQADSTPREQPATTASKKRTRTKKAKSVATAPADVSPDREPQPSNTRDTGDSNHVQEQNSVTSGETGRKEGPKLGPLITAHKRRGKDGPKRNADSTEIPRRQYYRPSANEKTYIMNNQGQLQCRQDPQDVTRSSCVKELPLCREKPIFHEPVGATVRDKEQLTSMYPNSFDRVGSLKGEYTIKIDPTVPPVSQARRKVPIESKEAICAALDHMIKEDILEPQIEPTPWVNSATYPVKPSGEVRPCLDCVPLNKAIIRENHTPPTVEEIAHELAGAKYFTKCDAYKAFLHVHLSKKSRELTVFGTTTHGRLRYKRMPFGMKMSQDVFQIQMDRILEQCPGTIGIHDDVIIYGYTREDHDANLINFLNVCQMEGLCLSSKKLELRRDRVSFFGAVYSCEGVEPDPRKIQGIEEMTPPETKQQLQSFLGMVTYMGNFVPHLSHHTEPLRQLLKKDIAFYWDEQLTRSFKNIKQLLKRATAKPLGYYDRQKAVIVQADASLRGLGAALIQDGRPIAFASKSLTGAESRYANIERELLTVVFACIRFNTYLQGCRFTVQSDHKPLEMIHLKSLHNAPPRLQRMLLQLQKYDMTITYRPGNEMVLADALSRCLARYSQEIRLDLRVDYIAFSTAWIEKLREATCDDPVLATVYQLTQHGWPNERRRVPAVARYYWDFRDELSTDDGLLLKGPSLVIPAALRESYLQRLQEGHLSADKVESNAKQHMFWPGMRADIKDYTRRCQVCIKRSRPAREPLQPHDIPDGPWQKIGMDYFDFKGKCFILICDYFSKFPFMFSCKTSWGSLRDRLIDLFSNEGYPREIISDNGSPFNSQEFADFLSSHGVRHTTSSPHYPQSNGFIERQIQTVKNLLYKAVDADTRSFQDVLAELRSTKIGRDLPSPAEILHGRCLVTGAPVQVDHASVRQALVNRQIKDSQNYNKSHRVKTQRPLVLGERCWATGTNNEWSDCYITGIDERNRSYWVLFESTGSNLRRTRSHIRPRGPDIPHISEKYSQEAAVSRQNSVPSGGESENRANQAENLVLSGPPPLLERDTAVDFIPDASRSVTFPDDPVTQTRYIPLRLRDTPREPRPPPPPMDLMTNSETQPQQQEEDHDNVPDTGSEAGSSTAETSGTLESSPDDSSTTETDETTSDTASTETSGSSSSSDGSSESDSAPSAPPSPRRTSTPCTEEAMTANVPSAPSSPSLADSSLEVRQILRDQAGRTLTRSEYQKQTNAAKERAVVLKRVALRDINQLPEAKPGPQPGPSGEPNGASRCVPGKQRDSTAATSSDEEERPRVKKKKGHGPKRQ